MDPIGTCEATKKTVDILDAKYEKAYLPAIVHDNCSHLDSLQQAKLLALLQRNNNCVDGTLGGFQTNPLRFHLQIDTKPDS